MNTKKLAIIGILTIIIIIAGIYFSGVLTKNGSNTQNQTITVLAGAGFVKVTNDLKSEFEKTHPGVVVNVKNGGSGELLGILETQKSADILLPADYKYMQDAINNGYIQNNTVKNITQNIPVIAVEKGNPKKINSLYDLTKPGIKVAIGDPKGPAIGKTTADILNKTNLNKTLQANIVVKTTTVNQLLTYLVTNQADAVIIWQDMATWPEGQGKIDVIQIPTNESKISTVPIAETVYTTNNNLTKEFENFVTSPQGMGIWEKWGFKPING
jgi:molybdate transport system substrate-binding protein